MFAKTILFVVGAILVVQVSGDQEQDAQWENVRSWFVTVLGSFGTSKQNVIDTMEKYSSVVNQRLEARKDEIEIKIQADMAELQQIADKAGVNASYCFQNITDGGNDFAESLLESSYQCIADQESRADDLVVEGEDLQTEVNGTIGVFTYRWTECENTSNVENCKEIALGEMAVQEFHYSTQEAIYAKSAAAFTQTVGYVLDECISTETASLTEELNSIMSQLSQCVQDIIKG